jgi:hypothetical protein
MGSRSASGVWWTGRTRAFICQLGFIKISGPWQLMCDASHVPASTCQIPHMMVTRFDETCRLLRIFRLGETYQAVFSWPDLTPPETL